MIRRLWLLAVGAGVCAGTWTTAAQDARTSTPPGPRTIGIFAGAGDVGTPSTIGPGSATYDADKRTYIIHGGGENMWGTADHFHYVWKKVSGDVTLAATIEFVGTSPNTGTPEGHRKACLVIRQTLDADSVYADAAVHGDGLTSLQYRDAKGGVTREVQSTVSRPARVRIEKRGTEVSMFVAAPGEELHPAGGSARIELTGEFYVGLAVSAHKTDRIETAAFSNVELGSPARSEEVRDTLGLAYCPDPPLLRDGPEARCIPTLVMARRLASQPATR